MQRLLSRSGFLDPPMHNGLPTHATFWASVARYVVLTGTTMMAIDVNSGAETAFPGSRCKVNLQTTGWGRKHRLSELGRTIAEESGADQPTRHLIPLSGWRHPLQFSPDTWFTVSGGGSFGAIPVNAGTNQLANAYYDLNGNMTSGAGATLTYDESNRLTSAAEVSGGIEYYSYSPDNKQVWRQLPNGNAEVYGLR